MTFISTCLSTLKAKCAALIDRLLKTDQVIDALEDVKEDAERIRSKEITALLTETEKSFEDQVWPEQWSEDDQRKWKEAINATAFHLALVKSGDFVLETSETNIHGETSWHLENHHEMGDLRITFEITSTDQSLMVGLYNHGYKDKAIKTLNRGFTYANLDHHTLSMFMEQDIHENDDGETKALANLNAREMSLGSWPILDDLILTLGGEYTIEFSLELFPDPEQSPSWTPGPSAFLWKHLAWRVILVNHRLKSHMWFYREFCLVRELSEKRSGPEYLKQFNIVYPQMFQRLPVHYLEYDTLLELVKLESAPLLKYANSVNQSVQDFILKRSFALAQDLEDATVKQGNVVVQNYGDGKWAIGASHGRYESINYPQDWLMIQHHLDEGVQRMFIDNLIAWKMKPLDSGEFETIHHKLRTGLNHAFKPYGLLLDYIGDIQTQTDNGGETEYYMTPLDAMIGRAVSILFAVINRTTKETLVVVFKPIY